MAMPTSRTTTYRSTTTTAPVSAVSVSLFPEFPHQVTSEIPFHFAKFHYFLGWKGCHELILVKVLFQGKLFFFQPECFGQGFLDLFIGKIVSIFMSVLIGISLIFHQFHLSVAEILIEGPKGLTFSKSRRIRFL